VLDLACGTGDIVFAAAPQVERAVGLDVTHRMLQLAMQRNVDLPPSGGRPALLPATCSHCRFPIARLPL
jgi:ubiquinone/menaquinone biosynthesis C-methylase UbiE